MKINNLIFLFFFSFCTNVKSQTITDIDPVKSKFSLQDGLLLPTLTKERLKFIANSKFIDCTLSLQENSIKNKFDENTYYKTNPINKNKQNLRSYYFYDGYLASINESGFTKINWHYKPSDSINIYYNNQINYHPNGSIKSFMNFVKADKLSENFVVGKIDYFNDNAELIYAVDFSKIYKSNLKDLYKFLYKLKDEYKYDNITAISRLFDINKGLWLVNYDKEGVLVIDSETFKIYKSKNSTTIENFETYIKSIFPNFDIYYKQKIEEKYGYMF